MTIWRWNVNTKCKVWRWERKRTEWGWWRVCAEEWEPKIHPCMLQSFWSTLDCDSRRDEDERGKVRTTTPENLFSLAGFCYCKRSDFTFLESPQVKFKTTHTKRRMDGRNISFRHWYTIQQWVVFLFPSFSSNISTDVYSLHEDKLKSLGGLRHFLRLRSTSILPASPHWLWGTTFSVLQKFSFSTVAPFYYHFVENWSLWNERLKTSKKRLRVGSKTEEAEERDSKKMKPVVKVADQAFKFTNVSLSPVLPTGMSSYPWDSHLTPKSKTQGHSSSTSGINKRKTKW